MSMYTLLRNNHCPSNTELENALEGKLVILIFVAKVNDVKFISFYRYRLDTYLVYQCDINIYY